MAVSSTNGTGPQRSRATGDVRASIPPRRGADAAWLQARFSIVQGPLSGYRRGLPSPFEVSRAPNLMSYFALALILSACVQAHWSLEAYRHRRRINRLRFRVHVNGIRGKSTVTRLIAGALREGGLATIAKSTGTAAAVINTDGADEPIYRTGPATILEQIRVIKEHVTPTVDAAIIECMALKPSYQRASEHHIVRSNIGVLTNVRHDHQDVMGESLAEIARSLLNSCPRSGILVTGEQSPEIVPIIKEVAERMETEVIVVDPDTVTDAELARFDYVSFKENVAIALEVARLTGIDRAIALEGMITAAPDPGVLRMLEITIDATRVTWANLFAVNDRESMIVAMDRLEEYRTDDTVVIGILNNRTDREQRALQFADIAAKDLEFDQLATFGAFERRVTDRLVENGVCVEDIHNLGDDHGPSIEQIIDTLVNQQSAEHILLVGFVNIHTDQAEQLMRYLEDPARRLPNIIDLSDAGEFGTKNQNELAWTA